MKIMLQGYLSDANFGDALIACLFYQECKEAGFEAVDFFQFRNYGIGPFVRNQLGYAAEKSFFSCMFADVFCLISGGSFWSNGSKADAKIRFRRFLLPALIYLFRRRPIYILGIGGGPVGTPWLRRLMVAVLNRAKLVYFRDESTFDIFQKYGVKNKAMVTADTALVIRPEMLLPFEEKAIVDIMADGRKKILLHIPDGGYAVGVVADVILPGLISFLDEHRDYFVVYSHDNMRILDSGETGAIKKIRELLYDSGIGFFEYEYHDCWQMCSLIGEMDCIVTEKLHVGVVGCALGKCVVSFPVHREKTDNFYRMIGESDRCVNARSLDSSIVYKQLEKFHDKPVHISEDMRMRASKNLSVLRDIQAGL